VAGTGNTRLAQLGHLGGMVGHGALEMVAPPRRRPPPPADGSPVPGAASHPLRGSSHRVAAVPVDQPSLDPARRGHFYPDPPPAGVAGRQTDRLAGTLESVGEELERDIQPRGHVQVRTAPDVASVIGDAVRQLQSAGSVPGQPAAYPEMLGAVARAMGVQPTAARPLGGDMTAVSAFIRQALALGLSGPQARGLLTTVAAAPDGRLSSTQYAQLTGYVARRSGLDPVTARGRVGDLLSVARAVPPQLTAYGQLARPPQVNVQVNLPPDPPSSPTRFPKGASHDPS
jgi:hypothetical protein